MRDLGYVEGQDLVIEYRDADGSLERLPGLAAELVGVPVEIIVASNAPAAVAASRATSSIPIVASRWQRRRGRAGDATSPVPKATSPE